MNERKPTMKSRQRFLELANVILGRLKEPRLQSWWNDLFSLLSDLEDCRRELCLPHWLSEWNADRDALQNAEHYDSAIDVRPLLDRWWKPGKDCHPDCFSISMQGTNGTADSVKFAFCDPYRSMDAWGDSYAGRCDSFAGCPEFVVVIRSLQVAEAEVDEGKPVFDDIRRDAIFILKAWIRYVEARPIPQMNLGADGMPVSERSLQDSIPDSEPTYSMTELCEFIGCDDNATVGKYLTAANCRRATRGQKNFRLRHNQLIVFLNFVVTNPRIDSHREEAKRSLSGLQDPTKIGR